jgi:hypothetical protein
MGIVWRLFVKRLLLLEDVPSSIVPLQLGNEEVLHGVIVFLMNDEVPEVPDPKPPQHVVCRPELAHLFRNGERLLGHHCPIEGRGRVVIDGPDDPAGADQHDGEEDRDEEEDIHAAFLPLVGAAGSANADVLLGPLFAAVLSLSQFWVGVKLSLDAQVEPVDLLAGAGFDRLELLALGDRTLEGELVDALVAMEETQGRIDWSKIFGG